MHPLFLSFRPNWRELIHFLSTHLESFLPLHLIQPNPAPRHQLKRDCTTQIFGIRVFLQKKIFVFPKIMIHLREPYSFALTKGILFYWFPDVGVWSQNLEGPLFHSFSANFFKSDYICKCYRLRTWDE